MAPSSDPLDLDLPASWDGLRAGLATVERHCKEAGIPASATSRLLVAFEEIFSNTVKYGYRGAPGRVRALLALAPGVLRLTLEDGAPEFDPTRWEGEPDLGAGEDERPIGGVGIAIALGLAREARWEPRGPGNRLVLELAAG